METRLDRTVAYVATCVVVVIVALFSWIGGFNLYEAQTERIAIENGYCQVRNGPDSNYYHWEPCEPANGQ